MKVFVCLGVVLICLACVSTRLPWVLDKVTVSFEKEFGPSAVYGKSNRAADLLCKHLLALVHSAVEEGKVLGVEFAGEEVGEVADLHRNLTKRADDKAENAPQVSGVHLCLSGPSCVRVRAEFCVELPGSFVVVFVYLVRALLDGCTECRGWRLRVGLLWCQRLDIPEGSGVTKACVRFFIEVLQVKGVNDQVWDDPLQSSIVVAVVIA